MDTCINKEQSNTSVKSSTCNYISIKQDITQILSEEYVSGTIMIVVHYSIKEEKDYNKKGLTLNLL